MFVSGKIIYITVSIIPRKAIFEMLKTFYYIKKIIFTVFVTSFLLSIGATVTSVYLLESYSTMASVGDKAGSEDNNVSVSEPVEVHYSVKEYNGIIGVYDLSGELMYTVEVYTKTLPTRDRELLKKGIVADSYEELLDILGDYTA